MTPEHSGLTFAWTPTTLVLGILLCLAAAALSFVIWKRSAYSPAIGALEGLRFLVVLAVALTLNQPEWRTTQTPEHKPLVAILRDHSGSMQTEDVVEENSAPPARRSRESLAAELGDPELWAPLAETLDLHFEPFPGEASEPGAGTDLGGALSSLLDRHPQLAAVVLLSDGDWNTGLPPSRAATRYRMEGIPIFAVPIGSEARLPDLAVAAFDVPTFGLVGKPVRLPYALTSHLPRNHTGTLEIRTSEGERLTSEVVLPAMGKVQDAMHWTPKAEGDYELTLALPPADEEFDLANNQLSAPIAIRREQLKILLIESYPRWEYRYLRNALARDPGVEPHCLLFHPDGSEVGGGPGYLKAFPEADQLAAYDVIFLGDVGVGEGQLSLEQVAALKQQVAAQASGLILMPGFRGHQLSLLDTELADLYPVQLDPSQPRGWGAATPGQFELTELGTRSLLTRLEDNENANANVWSSLPGFQWYAGVVRARPGSEVLATHSSETNRHGRIPLIATKTYGTGKILFMGTDGAWRWRKGVEDRYHYRFWGQVARWMAYQRNMASDERMRLFYSPDRPRSGDTLTLNANVMSVGGEPLQSATVIVQITAPSGRVETVRLQAGGEGQWGLFTGIFSPSEPGEHRLLASCAENGGTLETTVSVQGTALERVGEPARHEVMEELARLTRGERLATVDPAQIRERIAALPAPEPTERRFRLWAHPFWAGALTLLLTLFWVGRKMAGAV